MSKFRKKERDRFHLELMRALMIQVSAVFRRFSRACKYQNGRGAAMSKIQKEEELTEVSLTDEQQQRQKELAEKVLQKLKAEAGRIGCTHPRYREDSALISPCKVKNCPRIHRDD